MSCDCSLRRTGVIADEGGGKRSSLFLGDAPIDSLRGFCFFARHFNLRRSAERSETCNCFVCAFGDYEQGGVHNIVGNIPSFDPDDIEPVVPSLFYESVLFSAGD